MELYFMNFIKQAWQNNKQLFLFILLMSVFRSAVADWYTVPTGSMQPTIKEGDRIIVNKMAYDLKIPFSQISLFKTGEPERGEIVVFESQAANNRLIKRVIGLPGDVVEMKNEIIFINGKALRHQNSQQDQKFVHAIEKIDKIQHAIRIDPRENSQFSNFNASIVPENSYLVLGDNRRNSADSRVYGFVPRHELKGKATRIAFSLNYDNHYQPRSDRFFKDIYAI